MLTFVAPCVPVRVDRSPSGPDWVHEPKLDGWRLQILKDGTRIALFTRKGNDLAPRLPWLCKVIEGLPVHSAIVDGELLPNSGNFYELASAIADDAVTIAAFDLLHIDGDDTRSLPLLERKSLLFDIIQEASTPRLVGINHFHDGPALLAAAETLGQEGVVSKRATGHYRSGQTHDWQKMKSRAWLEANRDRWRSFARAR